MFTPFEQFEVVLLKIFTILGLDSSFTNLNLVVLTVLVFLLVFLSISSLDYRFLPRGIHYILETIYLFVLSIVIEQAGKRGLKFFPHFMVIFSLIICYNLIGLIPFSFTVTSQIIITFTLGLSYFIGFFLIGCLVLGTGFLRVFCPRNMPAALIPLLIIIEVLSFFLRPISLGVRLFANMLAGHILLHIIAAANLYLFSVTAFLVIPGLIILSAISVLELGISVLQAYIFTILLVIYLKDSLIAH
jgi:F-type H+-transporting ATPase subunit a